MHAARSAEDLVANIVEQCLLQYLECLTHEIGWKAHTDEYRYDEMYSGNSLTASCSPTINKPAATSTKRQEKLY